MKLENGKDIILGKGEKIQTYKNKFNGEVFYSSNLYETAIIDGNEFLKVFPKPISPSIRRINLMRKDLLERIFLF